nr:retrovirus-related Pol polyprotein from transposon TNT 1-94 [Tanacetum cinerariifolium]
NARTPQQNRVAERKNKTLIEAARTMLADLPLPIPFWAEAVNTSCYVQNRVLVTKPHNKTPYELLLGRVPVISFMRPFGCPVTILNTLDHLGKFDGKADEGFFVGYSISRKAFRVYNSRTKKNRVLVTKPHNKTPYELLLGRVPVISFMRPFGCPDTILNTLDHLGKFDGKADEGFLVGYSISRKAFRVYNSRTKKVEENLHVNILENKPNVARSGPEWLFDTDSLTNSMNYQPKVSDQDYILLAMLNTNSDVPSSNEEVESSPKDNAEKKSLKSQHVLNHSAALDDFPKMPNLEDTRIFDDAYDNRDEGA